MNVGKFSSDGDTWAFTAASDSGCRDMSIISYFW